MTGDRRQGQGRQRGGAHWRGGGKGHRGKDSGRRGGKPADASRVAQLLLYREARQALDGRALGDGNAGLWWNKFCASWKLSGQGDGANGKAVIEVDKLGWIKTMTGMVLGDAALLSEHHERRGAMIERRAGEAFMLDLQSRFVTGLGLEHPIENGFAWHHSLGVPYLAGSAVKGLTRAFAETWLNGSEGDQTDIDRIFGAGLKAGSVTFLDGLPTRPVRMAAEVATPHLGTWLQSDRSKKYVPTESQREQPEEDVPADWVDPNPIPFLTVERGQTMAFALLPRRSEDRSDCAKARPWLHDALTLLGAGAKTAVGYGLFAEQGRADRPLQAIPSPWLRSEGARADRDDRPRSRPPLPASVSGGLKPGDRVALRADPDSGGKVIGFEDKKVLVAFDDGEEALPADSLKRL